MSGVPSAKRPRAANERDGLAVGRDLGAFGHEPIDGVGLIGSARHQWIEQELEPFGRVALEDVVVETVERGHPAPADEREDAAFRGVGIGIGEMREIGRVGQVAEGRETVLALGGGRVCEEKENEGGTAGG